MDRHTTLFSSLNLCIFLFLQTLANRAVVLVKAVRLYVCSETSLHLEELCLMTSLLTVGISVFELIVMFSLCFLRDVYALSVCRIVKRVHGSHLDQL